MIKTLPTFILLLLLSHTLSAQFGHNQYFDGADTSYANSIIVELDTSGSNIWQIGPPQKSIFNAPATAPNSIVTDTVQFYPNSNSSSFVIQVFDFAVAPWGIFALQWMQKLDMDINEDGGIIEFSTDQGNTWQNAFNNPYVYNFYGYDPANQVVLNTGEDAFSGTDADWKNIWLCFDLSWMAVYPDTLRVRFTFKSDSIDNSKEGWLIDNMMSDVTWIHTAGSVAQTEYLKVHPNPSSDIVHVEIKKIQAFHIIEHMELSNLRGQIVEQWDNIPTKFWFDVSKYPAGLYFLKVKTNIRSETVPIIVGK